MYTYLEQRQQLRLINLKKDVIIPLQETINFEPTIKESIPLYDFYAFSEIQSERDFTLIEGPENSKNFICM
jgi:hypothetical protein